jgi:hypothetical protein
MPSVCKLSPSSVFLDVGSGLGQVPLFVRTAANVNAVGVVRQWLNPDSVGSCRRPVFSHCPLFCPARKLTPAAMPLRCGGSERFMTPYRTARALERSM